MKKILFLSCYDQPNGNSLRTFNYAKSFAKQGYDVSMVCNNFSHMTKKFASKLETEVQNGVKIYFIKNFRYSDQGISRIIDMIVNFFGILKFFLFKKFDIIISPSVPLTTSLAGLILFFFNKKNFFFEIRDVWPDCLVYNQVISKKNPLYWFFKIIEILCYKYSTKIITTLPNVEKHIRKYDKRVNIYYIPNAIEINNQIQKHVKEKKFKIIYVGRFSNDHDTDLIINCAKELRGNNEIHFSLYGDGYNKSKDMQKADFYELKNISFYGYIDKSKVLDILSSANVLIAPITDSKGYQWGINLNKIYDYMNAARPIIFSGNVPNNLVLNAQGNFTAAAGDYKSVIKHIKYLNKLDPKELDMIGLKNHNYLKKNFSLEYLSKQYISLIS